MGLGVGGGGGAGLCLLPPPVAQAANPSPTPTLTLLLTSGLTQTLTRCDYEEVRATRLRVPRPPLPRLGGGGKGAASVPRAAGKGPGRRRETSHNFARYLCGTPPCGYRLAALRPPYRYERVLRRVKKAPVVYK